MLLRYLTAVNRGFYSARPMNAPGSLAQPLRVAIIGSGPAAFYAAEHLLKQEGRPVSVDMIDRLPTPYGLVRGGVAPDHLKIKTVIAIYEKAALNPAFRFFGNVEFGKHITRADLERHFHAVIYATGAPSDRRLGVPGEDLQGSHSATEFVAWYNGHPDFSDRQFDLSAERVAVIGMGNVAIDVARILCLGPGEFKDTDMADHAIAALSASRVREVCIFGRRGPVQAAFTTNEVRELGEMVDADVVVRPEEAVLDALSLAELEAARATTRAKVEIVQGYAKRPLSGKRRQLHLRFMRSPLEIRGDARGHVSSLELGVNRLVRNAADAVVTEATGERETYGAQLVFRSVGYRGVALNDVPFDERSGLIPNLKGRVLAAPGGAPLAGHYASGWIKRGPTGVIGNNKADSVETVNLMMEDLAAGSLPAPPEPDAARFDAFVRGKQGTVVTFADWQKLDRIELDRGRATGRPRVKFTSVDEMLAALRPS